MSKQIDIVIDARLLYGSGIGTYLKNIVFEISNKFNVLYLVNQKSIDKYPKIKELNYKLIKSDIYSIKEQIELSLKIPKCKIFWSPHYNIPIFPIRANKRLVTIHDTFHLAFKNQLNLKQRFYSTLIIKLATLLSDKIITVSNFSKKEIIYYTKVDSNKISVIYNGLTNEFNQNGGTVISKNSQFLKKYILFVGNLKSHKNLITLIKAFTLLNDNSLNLIIIGNKDGLITIDKEILGYIDNSENIIFLENLSNQELQLYYKNASIFVFPTLYEGFGYPPLEAINFDVPVICSDIEVLKEIYGNYVLYFDKMDYNQLSQLIKSTIEQSHPLNNQDKDLILQKYSYQNFISGHIQVIESLLK